MNIIDYTMIIFAAMLAISGWYVWKLASLSEGWKYVWVWFMVFLATLPGSRVIAGVLWDDCDTFWEGIVKVVAPIVGGVALVCFTYGLYKMFAGVINKAHEALSERNRVRDIGRDSGRDRVRDAARDVARDKEVEGGKNGNH